MANTVEDMKALISKKGGLAKTNRFNVIFTPPSASLFNLDPQAIIGSLIGGRFSAKNLINDPRDISLLCESAQLPGRQITTFDYMAQKQSVKIPYTFINEDVSLTFLLTNDYSMKTMFDDWMNSIIDRNYRLSYKKEFTTDVIIQQLDHDDVPVYGIKLENAFPTSLQAIELNNTSENSVQRVTVQMSYDNWVPEGPLSSTGSAVRAVIDAII